MKNEIEDFKMVEKIKEWGIKNCMQSVDNLMRNFVITLKTKLKQQSHVFK